MITESTARRTSFLAIVASVLLPNVLCLAATVNIADCGAMNDGKTLCTKAIQTAIDRCASAGGGTVYFPPGKWLTGTLWLKSHVTLQLDAGCVLVGSTNQADYPQYKVRIRSYTDNYVCQSLLAGEDLENVAICGRGTIDGSGAAYHWTHYLDRPYLIRLAGCRDVVVSGIHLRNSGMWMQHYLACDYVRIQNVTVWNHVTYNNDGLDIDGCQHVIVSGCMIDSGDDALCLKSTFDRACKDIAISNCVLSSHCNAIKMGTESNGGFQNISISNCTICTSRDTKSTYGIRKGLAGIALEMVDGGRLERIAISNIVIDGVTVPIFMRLGNRARPFKKGMASPGVGTFRQVTLNNIVATDMSNIGCSITGLAGHPVQDVTLSNIQLSFAGGGTRQQAVRPIPELERAYPEGRMFGVLPAYGFYCRHVAGLTLRNIRLQTVKPDRRPAIVMDDVKNARLDALEATSTADTRAVLRFTNVRNSTICNSRLTQPAQAFLEIVDTASHDLWMTGNDAHLAARFVLAEHGAPAKIVAFGTNRVPSEANHSK